MDTYSHDKHVCYQYETVTKTLCFSYKIHKLLSRRLQRTFFKMTMIIEYCIGNRFAIFDMRRLWTTFLVKNWGFCAEFPLFRTDKYLLIFAQILKFYDFSMTRKLVAIIPGFPGAVGTLSVTDILNVQCRCHRDEKCSMYHWKLHKVLVLNHKHQ